MLLSKPRWRLSRAQHFDYAVLLAVLSGSAGCSKGEPVASTASAVTHGFQAFACAEGLGPETRDKQIAERGRQLHISRPADYVTVQRRTEAGPVPLAEVGIACKHSGQKEDCSRRLGDMIRQTAVCPPNDSCDGVYAIVESGGQLEVAATPEQLTALLRPIDSEEEAWFIAQANLKIVGSFCGEKETSAFRRTQAGYDLRYPYASKSCEGHNPEMSTATVSVKTTGEVQILKREVTRPQDDPCP